MKIQKVIIIFLVLFLVSMSLLSAEETRRRKKLIETGWDMPDSKALLENLSEMEKQPFDGVVVAVNGRIDDKKICRLRAAFLNADWNKDWFQPCINDLKACKFKRFTDNFISVGANPGNVDWFDDEGWTKIVDHWRIAAWIVKQSGVKGILFDPEPYTPPHSQFSYSAQPQKDKHTFEEYSKKARERGRQVMQAIGAEHPGIVVFCYFMNSVCHDAISQNDPQAVLERQGYGLLPSFIDGWLDAIPPAVTLVDGCESAYHYNSVEQYLEAANAIRNNCQELVSPENRAKYRAQVQASFGMYLDAYWNPSTSPWYIDGLGGSRVERLRINTTTALRAADEYVWVYGEKFRWWPTPNGSVKKENWDEALPGSGKMLALVRDPSTWAAERMSELKKDGKLVNLVRNSGFTDEKCSDTKGNTDVWRDGRPPAGWGSWQEEKSKGKFLWDRETGLSGKGAAKAESVKGGCFIQSHDVKAGEMYVVTTSGRIQGKGRTHVRVRWQTAEGKWIHENLDRMITPVKSQDGKWSEMTGVAEVPANVGKLVILLGVSDQRSTDDVAWFDDVLLYRIE
ncbi:MAG: hypothetical protein PHR77_07825 [Kiritimatiellae bacterium]|nr:hypothetical protein [Kiritimatiellia bacterium]MDD5520376.1 hypothetical protein [Kiritimatiellia bacterium]